MYPDNYRYTKDHEWLRVEGEAGTVGITIHAQKELGDIVYVDLPKAGTVVEKGASFGSVESVKAVSEVYSPVSGEVLAVNELLATAPEKVNEDAHGEGWLITLKLRDAGEIKDLMTAAEYESYVEAES
jgi:glycine cleavage system H protein